MISLPRECEHCHAMLLHYGKCGCPGSVLDGIDAERAQIKKRLAQLDEMERDATRAKLVELGVVPPKS